MAITHAWSSAIGAINGNSIIGVIPPSSIQASDVFITFGGKPGRAAGGIGPTGTDYTQIMSTGANGTGPNFGAWYKIMGAVPDASVRLQGSANAADGTAYGMYVFRGVSSVVFDIPHQSVRGNSTNPNPPSVITLTNNAVNFIVAGSQVNDAAVFSVLGYSNFQRATANDNLDISIGGNWASIATAGTTDPGAYQGWATASWIAATIVLKPAATPTVTTSVVSEITQTTATGGGNVTADGGATITERGVAWGTGASPTSPTASTAGTTGLYQSSIVSLSASTHYYARAFATNIIGTSYGSDVEFDTLAGAVEPVTQFEFGGIIAPLPAHLRNRR